MNRPPDAPREPIEVLIVEDSEDDALLILGSLREGGFAPHYERIATPEQMREALAASPWRLILSDYRLPRFNALEAFAIYREFGLDIPFLIVSGVIGEETAVAAMKAGVHDCVSKNNLGRLAPAVRRELRDAETRLERERAQSELRRSLTELEQRNTELHESREQLLALNRDLDRRLEQLESALAEKEVLFKEVQHRVKNNLQVISSLLSLQAEQAGSEQARAALAESRDRVRSMALIHEQLSHSGHMAEIEFAQYTGRLTRYLVSGYRTNPERIRIDSAVDVILPLDQAIPCGLIIQELLSNSLKHAFPNDASGEISIEFHESDGEYRLNYGDNGTGLPPDFDLSRSASLGMQLISDLAAQLRAEIKYFNSGGANFELRFGKRVQ